MHDRTQYSSCITCIYCADLLWIMVSATMAWSMLRNKGCCGAACTYDSTVYPWLIIGNTIIIYQIANGEIVAAINDEVYTIKKLLNIASMYICNNRINSY